jgi:hypothetical protein
VGHGVGGYPAAVNFLSSAGQPAAGRVQVRAGRRARGAAALVPQVFSLIQLRFTGPARVRALSAYAAVLSAGAVAGLVLGGAVVSADLFGLGWCPVFGINAPIGIALALAVPRLIPRDEPRVGKQGTRRFNLAGPLVAGLTVLLVVPVVLGPEAGWPAASFATIAAGVLLGAGFVLVERRVAARGGTRR